jgi:Na+-transporting methylmalonyl-CoA/oxaloacetate decarboxylase beta subunit
MDGTFQAASIGIIGGADGPTAIYLGPGGIWLLLAGFVLYAALFALAVLGLVRSIRKKRRLRTALSAALCAVLVLMAAAAAVIASLAGKSGPLQVMFH